MPVKHTEHPHMEAVRNLATMDDASSGEGYDRIARLVHKSFRTKVVLIGFIDGERHRFKSRIGTTLQGIPARQSICAHTVAARRVVALEDVRRDDRFRNMAFVAGKPFIRFYAGAPLITNEGHAIGTVALLDPAPRRFNAADRTALEDCAALVMEQVDVDWEIGRLDPLTRLPNRQKLLLDLQTVTRNDPGTRRLLVLVDLVSTRHMDEALGVLGIDLFNEQVKSAARLLRTKLAGTTIYHLGAAYLAFLLRDDGDDPSSLLEEVIAALRDPITNPTGVSVALRPCVGVRRIGPVEVASPDVLRTVLSAARQARMAERSFAWYNAAEDSAQKRAFGLLSDFPAALRSDDQFHLVYQPRIELRASRCVAVEALLRWKHPILGTIPPSEFFPLVKKTGLIRQVTDLVMRKTIAQAATWKRQGMSVVCSFNISAWNLHEDDFVDRLQATLLAEDVDAARIEVEIVEDRDLDGSRTALRRLEEIRDLGVRIAIDDFGSGYSNMAYLLSLPVSTLKIDRSLVARLPTGRTADVTVSGIINLGHKLGYTIVAEGIENAETCRLLRERGCDEGQGYFISRPLGADELIAWLGADGLASDHLDVAWNERRPVEVLRSSGKQALPFPAVFSSLSAHHQMERPDWPNSAAISMGKMIVGEIQRPD